MLYQRTIRQRVRVEGIGLHTGKPAALSFGPAPAGTGIHFIRRDLPNVPSLKVHVDNVVSTNNATTLGSSEFSVSTVEHCLSAVSALRIDNMIIELEGPEIPIVDGSSKPFLDAILEAGFADQDELRKYVLVKKTVFFGDDSKHAYVTPYNGLRITCTIDFPHPMVGVQTYDIDVNLQTFSRDIAGARTFGFLKDVEYLHSKGLALGGSLDNAIVLDGEKVVNPNGLQWNDEFVRHKVLDALGDLVTLGYPMMGHLTLYKAGHDVMNKLIKKILSSPEDCRLMELGTTASELNDVYDFNWMSRVD